MSTLVMKGTPEIKKRSACCNGAVLAILCVVCGCRGNPTTASSSLFPNDLSGDAHRTYAAHVKAFSAETDTSRNEIPPTYWAKRIKALRPLRVYTHRVNIVVVQRVIDGTEEGKYILIPVSSYLPEMGVDGFEFSPDPRSSDTHALGEGVFDCKRTMGIPSEIAK